MKKPLVAFIVAISFFSCTRTQPLEEVQGEYIRLLEQSNKRKDEHIKLLNAQLDTVTNHYNELARGFLKHTKEVHPDVWNAAFPKK
jgi:hypothetical protein